MAVKTQIGLRATIVEIAGRVCVACGFAKTALGASVQVAGEEQLDLLRRAQSEEFARHAVDMGNILSTHETEARFPSALWLPAMGLSLAIGSGALLDISKPDLRAQVRAVFGVNEREAPVTIETSVGDILVDQTYFDHLFEEVAPGIIRADTDHAAFASLTAQTLERPLEVFEQQLGGAKTRRLIFLASYIVDSAYTYHLAVVTRDRRLLTSYRLNGGRKKFVQSRFGVPRFVAY